MKESVPTVFANLKSQNYGYKVKLRYRKTNDKNPYILYFDYYQHGTRRTKSAKLNIIGNKKSLLKDKETLMIALAMRNDLEKKIIEGESGILVSKPETIDFLELFKEVSKKKPDTNYRISYNYFCKFINKNTLNIKSIDYALCENYKEFLLSQNIKPYTALHYFVTFKATLTYAVTMGYISINPAKGITIKYAKKNIERLSKDEVQKLMETDCKNQDLKNGFLFACFTGLRLSDLQNLKHTNLEYLRNGVVHLKIIMKKTKTEIEMKLHPNAVKILKIQLKKYKNDLSLFNIPTGGKRSKLIKEWFLNAGITKKLTFHCSRHTFGCLLIENGVDVFTVKKLMGHKDIKTTLQYVEKVDETKDRAIDLLPTI